MISNEVLSSLYSVATERGFTKRGKAYFRVHGDGVLQVIKFEFERCFSHHSLDIGLHSMYGELQKQWFTSSGCIPRYQVVKLEGKRNTVDLTMENGLTCFAVTTPENQLQILLSKGFDWFETINTQRKLADALCYLDTQGDCSVIWNDSQKLWPYLADENYAMAEKVLSAIIEQHMSVLPYDDEKRTFGWTEAECEHRRQRILQEDWILRQIQGWIHDDNRSAIQSFLEQNLATNSKFARFCMK